MTPRAGLALAGAAAAAFGGCARAHPAAATLPSRAVHPLFQDVAPSAGIRFNHINGASGQFRFVEFSPAGCAFLDYDNDGRLDVLLVQSGSSDPPAQVTRRPHCALYHNDGAGTFTDVTAGSGLDRDLGYAHGVAVGDYDNDGYDDLFLTSIPHNYLFHNESHGGKANFRDVTHAMGLDAVHSTGYATSAVFGDYDNDGRLDLFVCYYAPWKWGDDRPCLDAAKMQDYCSPEQFPPDTSVLYHNEGAHFRDISHEAGIDRVKGRALAAAFVDDAGDGAQDIYVANDLTPAVLWRRGGRGRFTNIASQTGTAFSEDGQAMAGMGIAVADYDHSGSDSLFVTNFSGMPNTLFRNMGHGVFRDVGDVSGLALPHMKFLSFGCAFLDYDADGWPDLLIADGSVYVHAETRLDGATYRERKQLFHNRGDGTFEEVADPALLGDLAVPTVARGLAVGDFDNDGRMDALVNNQNGPAQLFRNLDRSRNHWISFRTVGVRSNRDGIGARITVSAGGMRQTAAVRPGSSYLSSSDRRVYFGLAAATHARAEIHWPSGRRDALGDLRADAVYTVTEGKGATR